MDGLEAFLGRNGFLPHGFCFQWSPGLLWTMVLADVTIALAYFSIPLAILSYVHQRRSVVQQLGWLPWLFIAFIFACGLTHVMDVWTLWQPDYGLQTLTKLVTAGISAATAVALWPLIPRALKIPSVQQLQAAIAELEAEVGRRRSAEDHALEVERSLAVTLASIDAAFIATDSQGRVTRMNAVAERITGWPQAEALDHGVMEVFEREGRPPELAAVNPVELILQRSGGADEVHDVACIARGSGQRTTVELRAGLTRDDAGQARGLVLVFRDVTQLRQAEAELPRLAAIVESSEDAIIGKTLQGRITTWNRAASTMFGYSATEAIGQPVQMLFPPGSEGQEMGFLDALARGERVPPFDTVRRAKDGHEVEVSVSISPIRDAKGQIVGASKIVRDISDKRRAEESRQVAQRLEAENQQILASSRLKSQFLANMSHELRTPLNAVIGFADLLHAGAVPVDSPKHHEFLGHIGTSGRHLLQLINDVLDLSKVESGKFEFFPEPVDLHKLVAEVSGVLHTALQRQHLTLDVQIDPALQDVVVDPARLKQVLYNYLSNAIKFTPDGGSVQLRASAAGPQHLRLEVEDTGIGIVPSDLPRLFVEFQQLDAGYGKRHAGTGLGLALTRKLVEAQGGSVGVRSEPGRGSVFHLVLPRHPAAVAQPVQRVLLIEEDAVHRQRLAGPLGAAGYTVDLASTAREALSHTAQRGYDGIALGLVLPDQGGLELLARIRSGGPSEAAPVVGLSMATRPSGGTTFAITDVLAKPLQTAQVLQAMATSGLAAASNGRVMVVDDDPLALELMCSTLRTAGLQAAGWVGGREALRDIDDYRPDAIVLDLMMPGFDGFEVLQALAQLQAWRGTPVFIWTSMLLTDEEISRLARSAQAVLGKGSSDVGPLLDRLRRMALV